MKPTRVGRRIAVVGVSGSGKSYVARALAERLGILYVANDALIWEADWKEPTPEQEYRNFDEATAGEAWVIDGNLNPKSAADRLVLDRIDTLVWLALPRREVWPQLLGRTVKRAATREELWHGNRESWRTSFLSKDSILWWSVKTYNHNRRRYGPWMTDAAHAHLIRVRLGSRREVRRWLKSVSALSEQGGVPDGR
ncbi:MAG: hypothetical protein AAF750_08080 [Planctomycetota bacterium]